MWKQAIGLTLSLRRLDLLEKVYLQSKKAGSPGVASEPDEELLRYVLLETTAGASGNERWGVEFREDVSVHIAEARSSSDGLGFVFSSFSTSF
jgi:hypothetical protein